MLKGRTGLYEALGSASYDRFILRGLNDEDQHLIEASLSEIRAFDLPIFHCLAARNRAEIVAVVSGEDYDVTRSNDPAVAAPLFQQVHAKQLLDFMALALDAGFSIIELTNGHEAYDAEIMDLVAECQTYGAGTEVQPT